MKRVILSSHGFAKNPHLLRQVLQLIQDDPSRLRVAIITTASAEWKEKNKHAIAARDAFSQAGFSRTSYVDVEKNDPNELFDFDVIYLNGGNPFYLLDRLKRTGADEVLKTLCQQGKLIIGVSGGGVVLFKDIQIVQQFDPKANTVGLRDFTGLGLVDIEMYPHYVQSVEKELLAYEEQFHRSVTRLADSESVIVSTAS